MSRNRVYKAGVMAHAVVICFLKFDQKTVTTLFSVVNSLLRFIFWNR